MKKEKTYTLPEIKNLWTAYTTKKVLKLLKAGKWEIQELEGKGIPRITATRAEIADLKSTMSFPEFLASQALKG